MNCNARKKKKKIEVNWTGFKADEEERSLKKNKEPVILVSDL